MRAHSQKPETEKNHLDKTIITAETNKCLVIKLFEKKDSKIVQKEVKIGLIAKVFKSI